MKEIYHLFFSNTFPIEIYEFTKKEIAGSADPNKIIAGGEV